MSIVVAETYELSHGKVAHVVARESLRHPLADEISIALGDNGYCRFPYSVELAFFKNGKWVTDIIEDFEKFADGLAGDTLVYPRVPLVMLAQFVEVYGVNA
jgi:hypothetical protein